MVRNRLVGSFVAAFVLLVAPTFAGAAQTLLLDFSIPGCAPCRAMRPMVAELARAGYAVREIDATREPELARQFQVDQFPTFIVLVDGREMSRLSGATTARNLVEMIDKSQQLAARSAAPSVRGQSPDAIAPIQFQGGRSTFAPESPGANPALQSPQAGRIVELESQAGYERSPAPVPPRREDAWPQTRPTPPSASIAKLTAATVRLSVEDAQGKSTGTGTIVDARSGEALILTCGHIFRESQGRGAIQVTLFDHGPQGAVKRDVVAGRMVAYDLERDLGLVSIWINAPVQVAPIAPANAAPARGEPVTSMGCNGGADPTPIVSRVNSVDRYTGHPNLQAAGAPVEGRSGGGLFDAAGQVVGVCFAADPQADEGLYAALGSIHAKLDELQLSTVYQQPAGTALAAPSPAEPPQVRGQDPAATAPLPFADEPSPGAFGSTPPANPFASAAAPSPAAPVPSPDWPASAAEHLDTPRPMTAAELATLDELARRAGASEVVCIIRPQEPGGKSEVITVNGASPAFVEALARSAAAARESASVRR